MIIQIKVFILLFANIVLTQLKCSPPDTSNICTSDCSYSKNKNKCFTKIMMSTLDKCEGLEEDDCIFNSLEGELQANLCSL